MWRVSNDDQTMDMTAVSTGQIRAGSVSADDRMKDRKEQQSRANEITQTCLHYREFYLLLTNTNNPMHSE